MGKYGWDTPQEGTEAPPSAGERPTATKRVKQKAPVYVPPKTIGACADRLYELKELKSEAQKAVDLIESEEKALKQHIIDNLPKSDATGAVGKVAQVTVVKKTVPKVGNWDLFYAHVKKTGHFELLNKALTKKAVEERWEAHKVVPGVETYTDVTLSVHKLK